MFDLALPTRSTVVFGHSGNDSPVRICENFSESHWSIYPGKVLSRNRNYFLDEGTEPQAEEDSRAHGTSGWNRLHSTSDTEGVGGGDPFHQNSFLGQIPLRMYGRAKSSQGSFREN